MDTHPIVPQLKGRARKQPPTLIVIHCTAGSNLQGAVDTLREKGLSYNYLIDKDGKVYKCLPVSNIAFHAGNSYGPREVSNKVSLKQNNGSEFTAVPTPCVNDYSIGISFVNLSDGKDPYTKAQQEAVVELIEELKGQFPSLTHLTGHRIVSPGRKNDPAGYQLHDLADKVNLELFLIPGIKY